MPACTNVEGRTGAGVGKPEEKEPAGCYAVTTPRAMAIAARACRQLRSVCSATLGNNSILLLLPSSVDGFSNHFFSDSLAVGSREADGCIAMLYATIIGSGSIQEIDGENSPHNHSKRRAHRSKSDRSPSTPPTNDARPQERRHSLH